MKKLTERQKLLHFITNNWHPKVIETLLGDDEKIFEYCWKTLNSYQKQQDRISKLITKLEQEL